MKTRFPANKINPMNEAFCFSTAGAMQKFFSGLAFA
jgi:hypothetical protein